MMHQEEWMKLRAFKPLRDAGAALCPASALGGPAGGLEDPPGDQGGPLGLS